MGPRRLVGAVGRGTGRPIFSLLLRPRPVGHAQSGMGYAVSGSRAGPFVKSATPLLTSGGLLAGPGGGSFFLDAGGRPWLAYHAWRDGGRQLYVSPLSISQ